MGTDGQTATPETFRVGVKQVLTGRRSKRACGSDRQPSDDAENSYDETDGSSRPAVPDAFGWAPSLFGRPSTGDQEMGPASEDPIETGAEDGRLVEAELVTVLLVGVALFLVPEPATSAVGIGLVAAGVAVWLVGRLSSER